MAKEYWSRLPIPPPEESSQPRDWSMSPMSPALKVDSLSTEPSGKANEQLVNWAKIS